MADIVDLPALLDRLQGFPPLHRVLLANAGTLQGTLSAFLGAPVTVDVVSQSVDGDAIHREVDLVCKERDLVACRATTEIRVGDARMRQLIVERSIGLGQIVALLGERTNFELDEVADEPDVFWRRYRMWGDSFTYVITETFPKDLYGGAMSRPPFPFFVGCGRSGTTLVRALVDAHPDMAIPPESHFVVAEAPRRGAAFDPAGFVAALAASDRFALWGLDRDAVAAAVATAPGGYPAAVRAVFGLWADRAGKPRYGDKTPGYVVHVPVIAGLFPEAVIVHVIRDGRDVAASFVELGWAASAEEAARHWALRVRRGRRAGRELAAGRYHELRYEDLVADPEAALRAVCAGDRPDVRGGHARPPGPGGRGGPHHQPPGLPPPPGRARAGRRAGLAPRPDPVPAGPGRPGGGTAARRAGLPAHRRPPLGGRPGGGGGPVGTLAAPPDSQDRFPHHREAARAPIVRTSRRPASRRRAASAHTRSRAASARPWSAVTL